MGTAHGLRNSGNGFFLANDTLVQNAFKVQKTLAIFFFELGYRHAGPVGNDFCNVFGSNLLMGGFVLLIPGVTCFVELGLEGLLFVTIFGSLFKGLGFDGCFHFVGELFELAFHFLNAFWCSVVF